jgi:hypothetical protein
MTDREWSLAETFIPPAKRGGRHRTTDICKVAFARWHLQGAERLALHGGKRLRFEASGQMLSPGLDGAALFLRLAHTGLLGAMNTVLMMARGSDIKRLP